MKRMFAPLMVVCLIAPTISASLFGSPFDDTFHAYTPGISFGAPPTPMPTYTPPVFSTYTPPAVQFDPFQPSIIRSTPTTTHPDLMFAEKASLFQARDIASNVLERSSPDVGPTKAGEWATNVFVENGGMDARDALNQAGKEHDIPLVFT